MELWTLLFYVDKFGHTKIWAVVLCRGQSQEICCNTDSWTFVQPLWTWIFLKKPRNLCLSVIVYMLLKRISQFSCNFPNSSEYNIPLISYVIWGDRLLNASLKTSDDQEHLCHHAKSMYQLMSPPLKWYSFTFSISIISLPWTWANFPTVNACSQYF